MQVFDSSNTIFQTAVSFINQTNKHIFLTGKAGTGKTTFLKYIKEHSVKKIAVVAPTGVAAINAGGVTIHSLFQIPPGTYLPTQKNIFETFDGKIHNKHTLFKNMRMSADKRDLLRELDLLVIDEVSMVRADLLDAMDALLRHFRRQPLVPFGGVQVLYIGDLFQLPPVVKNQEWELLKEFYRSPFFFDAQVIQQMQPVYIELKKIYRQSDDFFINILNNIRNNCCTENDLNHLHQYYKPGFSPAKEENFITLTTHNDKADAINYNELKKLPGKLYQFKAQVAGEFNERSFPADDLLQLKEGAQIMFIKNDSGESRRYFNGKIGTIHSIDKEKIQITFPGEKALLQLEKETWQSIRYHYNQQKDKIEEEELGTFIQYPIRLAWAITIHKSQGLTFNKAVIDAGSSFAAGQVYVALSRLTGLNGLVLKSKIHRHCILNDQRVLKFVQNELPEDILTQNLQEEQQCFIKDSLIKGFGWEKWLGFLQQHLESLEQRQLPDIKDCIEWGNGLIRSTEDLNETTLKFQKQLEKLFEHPGQDNYKHLHERITAACNYFIKETDVKLSVPLEKHIAAIKIKSKSKKYLRDLYELKRQLERKKQELQNMQNISSAMHQSGNGADIYKVLEALQNPVPNYAPEEEMHSSKKKLEKGETQRITLQLFIKGKTIAEIAKERNLAFSTIEAHLAGFVITGEIDVLDIVDEIKLEKILQILEKEPELISSSIKQKLGDNFSYGEIKAAMKYWEMKKVLQ